MCEQLVRILERLELKGVSERVIQEKSGLLAHLTLEADTGLDDKPLPRLTQSLGQLVPGLPGKHDAEMRHRYLLAIYGIGSLNMASVRTIQVRDQLMTKQVEIHPLAAAASFRTTEQAAVERTRRSQVVHRNGKMKR